MRCFSTPLPAPGVAGADPDPPILDPRRVGGVRSGRPCLERFRLEPNSSSEVEAYSGVRRRHLLLTAGEMGATVTMATVD